MIRVVRQTVCSNFVRSSIRTSQNLHPILATNTFSRRAAQSHHVTNYATTATLENRPKGLFQKMLGKLSNSKSRLRASSVLLYENVADVLNYREFFDEFDMPDTFNSWFLVTELHTWLVLTRVMAEGPESGQDGRFLRNCIVEAMWADVQTRAKKISQDNPSASRAQVQVLSEQFQATLINYDEGLTGDDKSLASALWRRFFEMRCDDYTKLERLVKYVRRTAKILDGMTREELIQKPKIPWVKLTD